MTVAGYDPDELAELPTLCTGQCCSLKIETARTRVWLCRVGGGVTVERYDPKRGRWEVARGDCLPPGETWESAERKQQERIARECGECEEQEG